MRDLDINQVPCLIEEEEEEERSSVSRKKLRLTKEQSLLLEESFRQNHTLNSVIIFTYLFINTLSLSMRKF